MSCKSERWNFVTTLLFLTLLSPFDGKLFFLWIFLIVTTTNSIISVSSFRIFKITFTECCKAILFERFTIDFVIIINFSDFDFVCCHLTRKKIRHFLEIDMARLLHLSALIWWKKLHGNFKWKIHDLFFHHHPSEIHLHQFFGLGLCLSSFDEKKNPAFSWDR